MHRMLKHKVLCFLFKLLMYPRSVIIYLTNKMYMRDVTRPIPTVLTSQQWLLKQSTVQNIWSYFEEIIFNAIITSNKLIIKSGTYILGEIYEQCCSRGHLQLSRKWGINIPFCWDVTPLSFVGIQLVYSLVTFHIISRKTYSTNNIG